MTPAPKTNNDDEIARKAYRLWEEEGRPEGRDKAHWHQAEQDLSEPVVDPIESVPAPAPEAAPKSARSPRASKAKAASAEATTAPKPPRRRKGAAPDA